MQIPGVDYAFPPRPDIPALAAAGFKFACRYGGPGTEGKWLHADEAAELAANGVWIVANAEGSADGLGKGYSVGAAWARSADAWFRSCGMPADRPIYFSADFDVTAAWPAVANALRGAASVIGPSRVGVYGSYNVMRWARRDGVAQWFWQTYAWSAGRWAPGNHVEQYRNGVQIAGADCDLNRALQADYGQWMPGRTPTKGIKMYVLVKKFNGDGKVYLADGMTCRWLETEQDLADIKYLASTGQIAPLYNNGEIQEVANLGVYGAELGVAVPVEVDAAKLAAELAPLLPEPPTADAIAEAVLDEDHERSAS